MGPPRSMVNTSASDAGATKSLRCAITSGRIAVGTVTVRALARDLGGVRTSPRPTRSMNGELTRTQLPSRATSPRRNAVTSPQRNEQNAVSRIRTPISALGHQLCERERLSNAQHRAFFRECSLSAPLSRHGFRVISQSSTAAVIKIARSSRYAFAAIVWDRPPERSVARHSRIGRRQWWSGGTPASGGQRGQVLSCEVRAHGLDPGTTGAEVDEVVSAQKG
jgi:hypothetical protein